MTEESEAMLMTEIMRFVEVTQYDSARPLGIHGALVKRGHSQAFQEKFKQSLQSSSANYKSDSQVDPWIM